jgi:apolipoprotein D and lipocalin family protein
MTRRRARSLAFAVLAWLAWDAAAVRAQENAQAKKQAAAMVHFEMQRYLGRWYEIAHLPGKAEKECVSDGIVLYAEGDKPGRFQFVAACRRKDNSTDSINRSGRAQDKSGDGRLQLQPFWPFWTRYWIFAVGPDYEWALVGTPNRRQLWVLSRQTTLPPAVLAEIERRAAGEGFDPAKLVMTPQSPQRSLAPADAGR